MSHRPFSPSGNDRWRNCPASIKAVEEMNLLGLSDTSEYAAEGTQAHEYCEKVLKDEMSIDDVPDDFREGVALYVDSILADVEFGGEIIAIEKPIGWITDSRVGGTPDCVHRIGDCLVITDFKYGSGEYVPPDSMQVKIYGYLAARKYGKKSDKQIELRIVQPRYIRDGVDRIRSTFWDKTKLVHSVGNMLVDAVEQVDANPDLCVAGPHCKWCPKTRVDGMSACPAHMERYTQLLRAAPLELQPEGVDGLAKLDDIDQLKMILDSEEVILALLKYAKRVAYDKVYKGEQIEGYQLVETYKNRAWDQDDDQIASELRALGVKYDDIWVEKIISPAAAEKLGLKGKIDHLVKRESNGLSLQREKQITKQIKSMVKKLLLDNPIKGENK